MSDADVVENEKSRNETDVSFLLSVSGVFSKSFWNRRR